MVLLRTEGLTKQFASFTAVDHVDYQLNEGELAAIIGPNGAGKTTFFNLLTGEYEPTTGSIYLHEEDITDFKPHKRVKRGLGRVFQITNIFPSLTTFENIRLSIQGLEVRKPSELVRPADENEELIARADALLDLIGLSDKREMPSKNLPHGDKRRLEIGMALALDPEILLMDEPTAGLPDQEIQEVTDLIDDIRTDHAVILVEHKMDVVMELSDRISVLHRGEVIAEGSVDEIRNNQRVQDVYIGQEETYA